MTRRFPLVAALLTAIVFGVAVCCDSFAEVGDVVMKRGAAEGDEVPVSYFPHWIHRMQYKCSACHDELFKMKAGAAANITMDSFLEGKACGACHDGKKAFESNFDTCPRCHRQQQ